MPELIPALLVKDKDTFKKHVDLLKSDFDTFQIDVMDGAFVPNRTWFDAEVIKGMGDSPKFELHLMVMNPTAVIDEVLDFKNVVRIIWHIEATANHAGLIMKCHAAKKEAGLAINPSTPRSVLAALYDDIDELLIMGAEPGFSGRQLDPRTVSRAERIHEEQPKLTLGFDVNVNADTIPQLKAAGITRFCAASAIWENDEPLVAAKDLQKRLS